MFKALYIFVTIGAMVLPATVAFLTSDDSARINDISKVMSFGVFSKLGIYLCKSMMYYLILIIFLCLIIFLKWLDSPKLNFCYWATLASFICFSIFISGVLLSKLAIVQSSNIDVWHAKMFLKLGIQDL